MKTENLTGKKCYDHLGGKLGSVLLDFYVTNGWLSPNVEKKSTVYTITEKGYENFKKLGIDLDNIIL